jgi:hypothetical protein
MRRKFDTQILWIVVFALAFWSAVWKHDVVLDWIHRASVAWSGR